MKNINGKKEINDLICKYTYSVELLSSPPRSDSTEPDFIQNTRHLYDSCIDEYVIEKRNFTTTQFLLKTGFDQVAHDSSLDLVALLLKLNEYNTFLFYHVETDVDEKNTEKEIYRIEVDQKGVDCDWKEHLNIID